MWPFLLLGGLGYLLLKSRGSAKTDIYNPNYGAIRDKTGTTLEDLAVLLAHATPDDQRAYDLADILWALPKDQQNWLFERTLSLGADPDFIARLRGFITKKRLENYTG